MKIIFKILDLDYLYVVIYKFGWFLDDFLVFVFATNFVFIWVIFIVYVCGSVVVVLLLVKIRILEGYIKYFFIVLCYRNFFNKIWFEELLGLRVDLII